MRTRRRQCPARGSGLAAHDEEVRAGHTHTDTRTGDAEAASPKQARAVGQSAQRAEPGELRGGCRAAGPAPPCATGHEAGAATAQRRRRVARLPHTGVMEGGGRLPGRHPFQSTGRRVWLSTSHAELLASVLMPVF